MEKENAIGKRLRRSRQIEPPDSRNPVLTGLRACHPSSQPKTLRLRQTPTLGNTVTRCIATRCTFPASRLRRFRVPGSALLGKFPRGLTPNLQVVNFRRCGVEHVLHRAWNKTARCAELWNIVEHRGAGTVPGAQYLALSLHVLNSARFLLGAWLGTILAWHLGRGDQAFGARSLCWALLFWYRVRGTASLVLGAWR